MLARRMKTIIKPYLFADSDLVTICLILEQLKKACNSTGASDNVGTQRLPFFVVESSAVSTKIRLAPTKNGDALSLVRKGVDEQKRIYTCVEAVNYLSNSYATDGVVVMEASELEPFKKYVERTASQFADALNDKALRYEGAFSEQRTRYIFVEGDR